MKTWEHRLKLWLRIMAAVLVAAIIGAIMPASWMHWSHDHLGLHHFSDAPITQYLARSLSGFYAFQGLVYWFMARDVHRYLPLIQFMGIAGMAAGVGFAFMDFSVGLPIYWAIVEGPTVAGLSFTTFYLARRAMAEESASRSSAATGTRAGAPL